MFIVFGIKLDEAI